MKWRDSRAFMVVFRREEDERKGFMRSDFSLIYKFVTPISPSVPCPNQDHPSPRSSPLMLTYSLNYFKIIHT